MSKSRPFRAEDWWIGKASLLLGLVYLFSIRFRISFSDFWLWGLCSLVTIIGFASLGYLVNDYFDQEKDARVGKFSPRQVSSFQNSSFCTYAYSAILTLDLSAS
jgi:4-hydroxybenzoate polyprenyltransferase